MQNSEMEQYYAVSLKTDELKALYAAVQSDYARYQVNQRQYVRMLRSLAAVDEHGNLWALGMQSGTWYRQIGQKWVRSEPAEKLFLIRKIVTVWICHQCKTKNTMDKRYCTQCGAERRTEKIGQTGEADETAATAIQCMKCGTPLKAGAKFCTHCGQKVTSD